MEKLHFFCFLTSKCFLAFVTFSLLACQESPGIFLVKACLRMTQVMRLDNGRNTRAGKGV